MRMIEGQTAGAFVLNLESRGSRFDEIEPAVRKIIDDARSNGPTARGGKRIGSGRLQWRMSQRQIQDANVQ